MSLMEKMMGLSKNAKGGARGDWTPGSGDDVKTARKEQTKRYSHKGTSVSEKKTYCCLAGSQASKTSSPSCSDFFFPPLHRSTSRRTPFKMFPTLCFKPQARTLCCCPNLKKIIIVQQSQFYTRLPSSLQCLMLTKRPFWNLLLFCGSFEHGQKRTGERRSCELHTSFKTPSRLLLSPKCFSSFHYLQPLLQTTHISIQTQVKRQDKQKGL